MSEKSLTLARIFCFCLFSYICTSFFYVFPSGNPQPGDVVMLVALVFGFFTFLIKRSMRIDVAILWAFVFGGLTFLINSVYYIYIRDFGLLKSALYYGYNAAIFAFVVSVFKRYPDMAHRTVLYGLAVSLVVQITYMHIMPEYESGRLLGTFNNPNQLAQWALFSACMVVMIRIHDRLSVFDFILIALTVYIQTQSLSKAGIICTVVFLACLPFSHLLRPAHKALFVFFSLCVLLYGAFTHQKVVDKFMAIDQIENTVLRLQNIGQESDDNARGRGYLRPLEYPSYLITGAGEGAYYRFSDFSKPIEIHSGLVSIIFSYGFLGFGVFLIFLFYTAKGVPSRSFLVLLFVVMLNGVTHHNIRFSHFWLFMGVAYGMRFVRPNSMNECQDLSQEKLES